LASILHGEAGNGAASLGTAGHGGARQGKGFQGEHMGRSSEINELVAALCKARPHFKPIVKDLENRAFNYKYAPLEEVLEAIAGPLAEQGLVLSYEPDYSADGETGVITYLYHTSGQWISNLIWMGKPEFEGQKALSHAQRIGSVVTYGRRYGTCMIVGIQPQGEDDDAATDMQKLKSEALKGAVRTPAASAPARATGSRLNEAEIQIVDTIEHLDRLEVVDKAEQKALERHEARLNRAEGLKPPSHADRGTPSMNHDQAYQACYQRLCILAHSDQERDLIPYIQQVFGTAVKSLALMNGQGKTTLLRGLAHLDAMPVHSDMPPVGDTPLDPSGPASTSATEANGQPGPTLEADVIEPVAKDLAFDEDEHLLPEPLDHLRRWCQKYFCAELVQSAIEQHGGVRWEDYREIKRQVTERRLAQRKAALEGGA
jgi:ERF superfamily